MARNHINCRECGTIHQNPESSSLCVPCGKLTSKFNKQLAWYEKKLSAALKRESELEITVEQLCKKLSKGEQ